MGGGKHYPYPKYVWSPAGGWWCNPRNWKRNTVVAGIWTVLVSVPVVYYSSQVERRYVAPTHPGLPTQYIQKYAKIDDPRLVELWAKK